MSDLFSLWVSMLSEGLALGFMLGFISWETEAELFAVRR